MLVVKDTFPDHVLAVDIDQCPDYNLSIIKLSPLQLVSEMQVFSVLMSFILFETLANVEDLLL